MQFHLNGFQEDDPTKFAASKGRSEIQGEIPKELDVLIIGSGPAGLTLAAQLATYPNITTQLLSKTKAP